ncbi:MAG TPA: hypothetical protein ENF81_05755 [Thermotogaceae bacterium]|nr:hypothetical protein [Thermotogaceae bacterium]
MFPKLNIPEEYIPYLRHPSRNKKVIVYAKIDGTNWYDISSYVKKVTIVNRLEFLQDPALDSATITLANLNNEWTPTQYNDVFDPANGKFNGTVDQAYLSKEWEVKILLRVYKDPTTYVEVPLFYGVKTELTEKHKTAEITLKDILYYATKKKLETDILYQAMTPSEILSDLLQRAGYSTSQFDFQGFTSDAYKCVFLAKRDKTYWQNIINLVKGSAGKISTKPDGTIIFRTRNSDTYEDPDVAADLAQDEFKKYDLTTTKRYNKIVVDSESYSIDQDLSNVVDVELGEDSVIEPNSSANFEADYVSDYAKDVSDTVEIKYKISNLEYTATLQEGEDDGTIKLESYQRFADKIVCTIKNLSSSEQVTITHLKTQGRQIKRIAINKVIRQATETPEKEYKVVSFFESEGILKTIADIYFDEVGKSIGFVLDMNQFYGDIYAGNLVNFSVPAKGISSGKFLVLKVEHTLEGGLFRTTLGILEWSGLQFQQGDHIATRSYQAPPPSVDQIQQSLSEVQSQVDELDQRVSQQEEKTQFLDGQAPPQPDFQLTSFRNAQGESIVEASWDEVNATDIIGYELQWDTNYNFYHPRTLRTSDTTISWAVPGNTTIYVRMRTLDAEGKKSAWTDWHSIISAKDNVPPSKPQGVNAVGLFQTIMVQWNENTEEDLSHYVLEYDTDENFSNPTRITLAANHTVIKELNVNTTYYIRVAAVDTSGNQSEWSDVVSASTAKIDDENYYDYAAIKNCIMHNGYIDSAWISELDAGLITTGYLSADRIEAGTITFEKLAFRSAFSVPEGAIAYWTNSLVDELYGITPKGYTEANLHPSITLLPENAPEGSVVADLLAADKVYGNHIAANTITADKLDVSELSAITANAGTITAGIIKGSSETTKFDLNQDQLIVGSGIVKIGKGVLPDGGDGILLNGSNLHVEGEIDTDYLDLHKAAIISLDEYKTFFSHTNQTKYFSSAGDLCVDHYTLYVLRPITITTGKGAQKCYKNIPIFEISVNAHETSGSGKTQAIVKIFYMYNLTKTFSTATSQSVSATWSFNLWDYEHPDDDDEVIFELWLFCDRGNTYVNWSWELKIIQSSCIIHVI